MQNFSDLQLSSKALRAVSLLKYEKPTPVQEQAIPLILEGRDIIAAAKTGTGKTAAFSLPAMSKLSRSPKGEGPHMLVVTPTRELAQQICEVCKTIAQATHLRVLSVVGGLSINPQIQGLKRGVDVLIATPGRLIDLMEQKALRLANVEVLVLDEADRMLDMGFWPSVKKIVAATPTSRQTLLFSATIDKSIQDTAGKLLKKPALVEIAHKGDTADTIEQYIVRTEQALKPDVLKAVLAEHGSSRVIVFTRTRSRADSTCRRLRRAGFAAEAIHSDRSQNQRKRALENFAKGKVGVLVATDVLSRGIDVEKVSYVVNYDLPTQAQDYVHRIGRTGRAGASGYAISFVTPDTKSDLKSIEKFIRQEIPELELKNFDAEEATQRVVARTNRARARKDTELAQAMREEKRKQSRKKKAKEQSKAAGGGRAGGGKRSQGKRPQANRSQGNRSQASRVKNTQTHSKSQGSPKNQGADFRPGRAHRASLAHKQRRH